MGPGAWVANPHINRYKQEFIEPFMAKYVWSMELPNDKTFGLPSFYYIEPPLLHTEQFNCDDNYETNINKCAADGSQICQVIKDFGRRNINGKLRCTVNWNGKGSQISYLFYGAGRDFKLKSLFDALSKYNYSGVSLDSISSLYAYYNTDMPTDLCPFSLLDDKNFDREFLILPFFNVFKNLSKYAPNGYMLNSMIVFPQFTKWAVTAGYEISMKTIYGMPKGESQHFWQNRFALGSRPNSHLDSSSGWDKFEEYFSYCSIV
ncbi:hypothetical protein TVAG_307860 [Trichomonas vaginalis G3]|uniref:Uncharacterized protein n=1 Tax=Trichomonas vaginalis (strain ATCC PRA-98 / G3) TaxID=412133 RepID=A2F439_TRIV3|nr:hypothetical protein TVAGG3_0688040 [Trichomonas vaginalis G3]EAY00340.1 hypothetical protein TVAG_307860 [Trichomonas vaginalis G3]KAI5508366.1 hypothetical protein TVAGG3_0688040 [Trichomonas vaginalis G3]|eukprot:XP_001313269.1 hypothetical protein [Trichomonas vaginalis G3]